MAESDSCRACNTVVRPRQEAIQCDSCVYWTQRTCNTGVNRNDYRSAIKNKRDIAFTCVVCAAGNSVRNETPTNNIGTFNIETSLVDSPMIPTAHSTATSEQLTIAQQIMSESTSDSPIPPPSFIVPARLEESSIAELQVPTIPTGSEDLPNEFEIISCTSRRGADKLYDKLGYSYTKKRENKRSTVWRCSIRNITGCCPATVTQMGDIFTPGPRSHNHSANPGSATAAKVARDVKKIAKDNILRPASDIVNEVLMKEIQDQPCDALQNAEYLARNANNLRQKLRPDEPKDLDFELQQQHIPTNFFRKDIKVNGNRHILFATDRQLEFLQNAKRWYIDSTFKVIRKPFYQLFSVHAFIKQCDNVKQVPLLFVLMSGKRTEDYKSVLCEIKELLSTYCVQELVIDFEAAMWNAFRDVFPAVNIRGCAFHFTQALWRKIQEVGLSTAYKEERSLNKYLRKFMALCFLPHEKIHSTFESLKGDASDSNQLATFISYVEKYWIQGTIWPPQNWSVFNQSVRTNNDTEGWHNRLNCKAKSNSHFYSLIEILHKESELVTISAKLISERKLKKRQRKQYRELQNKLFEAWDNFISGEINVKKLLKQCASLNGPTL